MSGTPLSDILIAKMSGKNLTPGDIVLATAAMTDEQKAETLANLGAADAATSIPASVKVALLNCFSNVAWDDENGNTYISALRLALYPLVSISAVYTQSGTVWDTDSLDSLKSDLVVTAVYQGGTTETVPAADYTLSGTLTAGTSTITVAYGGLTTTFDVTVSTHVLYSLEDRAFDTERINTNVLLIDEDKDWSIAMDATLTTSPTSGDGSAYRFIGIANAAASGYAISFGKSNSGSTGYILSYMGNYDHGAISSVGTGRYRFVLTHAKNSGKADMAFRKDTGSAITYSQSGTFAAAEKYLYLGANTTTYALPKGTINKAYVYDIVLSSAEINAFLGL